MTHTFGPGEYRTRDGRKAVVLHVLERPIAPYRALIGWIESGGQQVPYSWCRSGHFYGDVSSGLLPPAPPPVVRWYNVYGPPDMHVPSARRTRPAMKPISGPIGLAPTS